VSIRARGSVESLERLQAALAAHDRVCYTRFGDGEVVAMMGKDHRNYRTSPGLVTELRESFTIEEPGYLVALSVNLPREPGMSRGVFAPYASNDTLERFLLDEGLARDGQVFESQILFHYLSVFQPELVYRFFERWVRPRPYLFVGCTLPDTVTRLYGPGLHHVRVPPQHAYDTIGEWWPQVMAHVGQVELVIPSAGAASNVIGKRLWRLGVRVHCLDIGSIIDAVDGRMSRAWIRRVGHRIQRVLPPEYRDRSLRARLWHAWKDLAYAVRLCYRR
jgi:hypothetical protein